MKKKLLALMFILVFIGGVSVMSICSATTVTVVDSDSDGEGDKGNGDLPKQELGEKNTQDIGDDSKVKPVDGTKNKRRRKRSIEIEQNDDDDVASIYDDQRKPEQKSHMKPKQKKNEKKKSVEQKLL